MGILDRIKNGDFLISAQLDPPSTADSTDFNELAKQLMVNDVSLVDINSSRRISHDSIQLAAALSKLGLETIPHITTRDSSINGLINQVLAAVAWGGVKNFLVITGDPYEKSKAIIPSRGVFQKDSIGALQAIDEHLRKNSELKLKIALGAAVNQNSASILEEGERIRKKILAGADFFMSQPVFDEKQAVKLFDLYQRHSSKPLLVGIWPLISPRTIENIYKGQITGVVLPDKTYNEAYVYFDDQSQLIASGLERAYQLAEFIHRNKTAQGIYIVAPLRNPMLILGFAKKLKASKLRRSK